MIQWILCLIGVSLAGFGILNGPVGKLTLGEASMIVIGVIFILGAITKSEGVWPFKPDKPIPRPAFSNLCPDRPVFIRNWRRRSRQPMIPGRRGKSEAGK